MISEIDINDWTIYPETPIDKMKDVSDFLYQGNRCRIKKRGFFSFDVIDANGVEFQLDFYTLVNPLKRKG